MNELEPFFQEDEWQDFALQQGDPGRPVPMRRALRLRRWAVRHEFSLAIGGTLVVWAAVALLLLG